MESKKIGKAYVLKLDKGDEIIKSVTSFCEEHGIESGSITGLGAADDLEISFFCVGDKRYQTERFNEMSYEIISLVGNIALIGEKPFAHIHIALGKDDYSMFGGHLTSGVVSVTCEITLTVTEGRLERTMDDRFNLNLLNLS